jgi:hypothetical protein
MATKEDIITEIQAVADASGDNNLRISLGAPGNNVKDTIGKTKPTGQAWEPEPKTWPVVAEGLANWADAQGIAGISDIKDKVNELVGGYMQLKADYDSGVVPTTAPDITPLP